MSCNSQVRKFKKHPKAVKEIQHMVLFRKHDAVFHFDVLLKKKTVPLKLIF
jgi:hypothetical protein